MMRLNKRILILLTFFLAASHVVTMPVEAQTIKEHWYMYRGRENKKIKNHKAAIEAFEKALEINPNNQEASRELGAAYESQGLVDKAVSQYDSYLAKWPNDPDVALKQARHLKWSRYSYRQRDAIKFYELSLAHKNDPQVRLEYADTLASKKETSGQAIREYQTVLRTNPNHPGAHRGLAKAYAWSGDQDRALYHSKLATKYGDKSGDLKRLESSLEKERRPEVGVEGLILHQVSSQEFDLSGMRLGAYGRYHLNPFLTGSIRGGGESFWNATNTQAGGYFGLGSEYRFGLDKKLLAEMTFHSGFDDGLEALIQYRWTGTEREWSAEFTRDLVFDSFLSLAGQQITGKTIGAARRHQLSLTTTTSFQKVKAKITPFFGWIKAASLTPNLVIGTQLELVLPFHSELQPGVQASVQDGWSLVGKTELVSYQRDHSGFQDQTIEPLSGGYFSPSLIFIQNALVRYSYIQSDSDRWSFEIGPSYQYVTGTNSDGSKLGGRANIDYLTRLSGALQLHLRGDVQRVADVYTQIQAMGWLSYGF